jgi:hypothetical protein
VTVAIQTWEDEQLATLRPLYPAWDIWIVPRYMAVTVWCARPKGAPVATINTDSPESLIAEIREQERQRDAR